MIKKITKFIGLSTILLIQIPLVFSIYEDMIFSEEIYSELKINQSGKEFFFRLDSVGNKAYADINGEKYIINSNECETKNNIKVCIENITFSHKNFTTFFDVYKSIVKVYQIKSEIENEYISFKESDAENPRTIVSIARGPIPEINER